MEEQKRYTPKQIITVRIIALIIFLMSIIKLTISIF